MYFNMDIPKMNLLFIIVVILQLCLNVNSQPGTDWDPSLGPSPAPAPGPSLGYTQGTSGDHSWSSPQGSTGSSSWGPPQSSTRGSSRPSQGTCNCGIYETCAMVRHGNAPPTLGCINGIETVFPYTEGRPQDNHNPIDNNPVRVRPGNVGNVGYVPGTEPADIQGRVSEILEDEYGKHFLFYTPGVSTGLRVNITKTGFCSRMPPTRNFQACVPSCSSDTECSGTRKCCPNGCSIGCVANNQAQPSGSRRGRGDLPNGIETVFPYTEGRPQDNHNPIDNNPVRVRPGNVGNVGYVPGTEPADIQGRVSEILEDEYGKHFLFYTPGVSTGLRVNITKTGFCSRMPPTRNFQACVPSCSSDTDCSGTRKCCPNGCSIGCVANNQAQPSGSRRGSGDLPRVCQPLTYNSDRRCLLVMPRWTYNLVSGKCEYFIYGGCGGSANIFDSNESCLRKCRPRVSPVTAAPVSVAPVTSTNGASMSGGTMGRDCSRTCTNHLECPGKELCFTSGGCGGQRICINNWS